MGLMKSTRQLFEPNYAASDVEWSPLACFGQLGRTSVAEKRPAPRLFAFSILYLFVLFAALLADAAMLHSRTA